MSVAVPKAVVGYLLGCKGEILKSLKEITNCNVRIDDRHDMYGAERTVRTASISAREGDKASRQAAVKLCARTLQIICEEEVEVDVAVSKAMAEVEVKQEERRQGEAIEKAAKLKEQEDEMVSRLAASVGDLFSWEAIREALVKENWSADRASDRLFNEREHVVNESPKPVLDMQRLLAAVKEAKARKGATTKDATSSQEVVHGSKDAIPDQPPSRNVMMIRDVFTKFREQEAARAA